MFTGLIEATATVLEQSKHSLMLSRPESFDDITTGSSIAVSGVCLSVADLTVETMRFDLLEETLKRTTLGSLSVGDFVNLERAMKIGDRFGGHIVQGHVDGVGEVWRFGGPPAVALSKRSVEGAKVGLGGLGGLEVRYPSSLCGLIVEKGSIAVDGVSLTVISVNNESFSVALIPETLRKTSLGSLHDGSRVNLEADIVGKYVRGIR